MKPTNKDLRRARSNMIIMTFLWIIFIIAMLMIASVLIYNHQPPKQYLVFCGLSLFGLLNMSIELKEE